MNYKNNSLSRQVLLLVVITVLVIGGFYISGLIIDGNSAPKPKSYKEQIVTIEEIENSNPIKFLSADGSYNSSFWGTKLKIRGKITNTATVASYKDVTVRVVYYSKTKTVLNSKQYTLYEIYPPNSVTSFRLDVENYKNVKSIGWEVLGALNN